ncbi:LLM class flavin-dependent oxidoreductase [Aeromicrobium sp. Marseille-Q0843]|uniref:LLM class flavin-dependent oxidoreductase n=1 Tax=Aeromicrobium phoceense TaxID=2754045 RepID=A0A838XIG1_9ACTN|nr:LLM class flavin-dependent oxidoreductase [Aeromicrobium phoceense]
MDAGVHLPQIDFTATPLDGSHLAEVVDAARDLGFAALSANDHLTFPSPWADGLVLLAAAAERSGDLELVTSAALPVLRGARSYGAAMLTLERLAPGRVVAGVGPGSSRTDYALADVPWEERWSRFDAALGVLRAQFARHGSRAQVPLWVASWGSPAGIDRVARYGDGWLASAFHTTPAEFGRTREGLAQACHRLGRAEPPHALVTMWTWVTEDTPVAERMLTSLLAPALDRDPEAPRGRVCVGPAETCAELLSEYAAQGCRRVHFWPVGDEARQLRRLAEDVLPHVVAAPPVSTG